MELRARIDAAIERLVAAINAVDAKTGGGGGGSGNIDGGNAASVATSNIDGGTATP